MQIEAELLDAGTDLDGRGDEVAVDEDVSAGRGDEVTGQVTAADVVEVPGDAEGRHGGGPVGVEIGFESGGKGDVHRGCGGCGEDC